MGHATRAPSALRLLWRGQPSKLRGAQREAFWRELLSEGDACGKGQAAGREASLDHRVALVISPRVSGARRLQGEQPDWITELVRSDLLVPATKFSKYLTGAAALHSRHVKVRTCRHAECRTTGRVWRVLQVLLSHHICVERAS